MLRGRRRARHGQGLPGSARRRTEPVHANLGVSAFSPQPDDAFEAIKCLANKQNRPPNAPEGGLPPTLAALYDHPAVQKAYSGWIPHLLGLQTDPLLGGLALVPDELHEAAKIDGASWPRSRRSLAPPSSPSRSARSPPRR